MDENIEQDDLIRIPPGWGPVIFLAVVIILSNAGLGIYVRGLVLSTPTARPVAIGKAGGGGGQPGGKAAGGGPTSGSGNGPGTSAEEGGGPQLPASTYEADEAEFTEELDAYIKSVAEEAGLDPEAIPTAKEIYEQMKRSGLLPRSQDVDLRTVLSGHIREMGKHSVDGTLPNAGKGGSNSKGGPGEGGSGEGGPGSKGGPGAPGTMQPPPEGADGSRSPTDMKPPLEGEEAQ